MQVTGMLRMQVTGMLKVQVTGMLRVCPTMEPALILLDFTRV